MDTDLTLILIAFPVAESMRTYMRSILRQPMPSLYREGAQNRPCSECGLTLNVGPRLLEKMAEHAEARLVCPVCLVYITEKMGLEVNENTVESLGNPEAGWEGEQSDTRKKTH